MHQKSKQPWISVVIATRDRKTCLKTCLDSLIYQTTQSGNYEIIVVLNAPTIDVVETVRKYGKLHGNIREIVLDIANVSAARNAGWRNAKADIIAFVDDDARVPPDWLSRISAFRERHPEAKVFGGPYRRYLTQPLPEWYPESYGNAGDFVRERILGENEWLSGSNMVFKREMLSLSNGFAEDIGPRNGVMHYGEDTNILVRLRKQGIKLFTSPELFVEHALLPYKHSLRWLLASSYKKGLSHMTALNQKDSFVHCIIILIKSLLDGVAGLVINRGHFKQRVYNSFHGFFYQAGVVMAVVISLFRLG